jgi:AcrR family transcriptional regulator
MNDTQEKILQVAIRVYAEAGYHGTTTRRLAEEAGVNEVTLFRHFGSKDALLRAAVERFASSSSAHLDFETSDPDAELRRWAHSVFEHFYGKRNFIRRVMADMVEFPEMAPRFCDNQDQEWHQLAAWLRRLTERGLLPVREPLLVETTGGLLLGALLTHALWRDYIPDVPPADLCVDGFIDGFWRAARAPAASPAPATTAARLK